LLLVLETGQLSTKAQRRDFFSSRPPICRIFGASNATKFKTATALLQNSLRHLTFPFLFSIQPCNLSLNFMRMKSGSKMAEQLKEYGHQIRPKYEWLRVASFASGSPSSSRYLISSSLTLSNLLELDPTLRKNGLEFGLSMYVHHLNPKKFKAICKIPPS
jgi:hypothetical protein